MQTEPSNECLSPDLTQELESVVQTVHSALAPVDACADGDAIALVRVFPCTAPEAWERFSSIRELKNWLCIPIKRSLVDSVTALLDMQQRLAFQRDHDALTGLANRGCFTRKLEIEVDRVLRSRTELALIYIDIDNFKNINDTYGHDCGDSVLIRLATIMCDNTRHYDVPSRLGGDEFCVILPAASCWTGLMFANRLLELFRREVFTCNGEAFSMTFSAGVVSLAQLDNDHQSGAELLKHADTALYKAKNNCKNSICLAENERLGKDHSSLVQAQEKQFLFSRFEPE